MNYDTKYQETGQIHGAGRDGRNSERICMTTDAVLNDAPPDTRTANAAYIAATHPAKIIETATDIDAALTRIRAAKGGE